MSTTILTTNYLKKILTQTAKSIAMELIPFAVSDPVRVRSH